jgi:hypothetical protein
MKQKIMMFVLGFYNLILAVGAISTGVCQDSCRKNSKNYDDILAS